MGSVKRAGEEVWRRRRGLKLYWFEFKFLLRCQEGMGDGGKGVCVSSMVGPV